MTLDISTKRCKRSDDLWYDDNGVAKLLPMHDRVAMYAGVVVGIPNIDDKDVDEFVERARMYDLVNDNVETYGEIRREDVERLVGLRTNGVRKSKTQFDKDIAYYVRMKARRTLPKARVGSLKGGSE